MPTGDFNQFIKKINDPLKQLYKPKAKLLICGDINIDELFLGGGASLLTTYNPLQTANFATRIQICSATQKFGEFKQGTWTGCRMHFRR